MAEIRIIHTSDLHDRLTRAKAERLRELKAQHDALLIDTGDAVSSLNVTVLPWRERAIPLMNEAGYDAMGLGNREYFFRVRGMLWKTGHAAFQRIATNIQFPRVRADGDLPAHPQLILPTAPGARVGLFALMPTMIPPGHPFEHLSDTRFAAWRRAARDASASLAQEADVVVALFHRPNREIDPLLEACPEARLVLAGHAHVLTESVKVAPTGQVISRVGQRATHARVIGLRVPGGTVTMDELVSLG